jgi:hypothetical protein
MVGRTVKHFICIALIAPSLALWASPREVSFSQPARDVETYDFVEITATVTSPDAQNPFTAATLNGWFEKAGGGERKNVEGFCDSSDGSIFRIGFSPSSAGSYAYSISYRQGDFEKSYAGTFRAVDGHRKGPIRVDPKFPWHFIWEGTGEHYFFNGTTAFWLMGFREERNIRYSIQRLSDLKINRIRVLLAGATNINWGEAVMPRDGFSVFLRPWPA